MGVELRRRIERGAGMEDGRPIPRHVEAARAEEAVARADDHLARQANRPLAEALYLQELAEREGQEDGRYLVQVLESVEHEIGALIATRGLANRELAMCLARLQEARHWAIADGVKQNSVVVIDRRLFKVQSEENAADAAKP